GVASGIGAVCMAANITGGQLFSLPKWFCWPWLPMPQLASCLAFSCTACCAPEPDRCSEKRVSNWFTVSVTGTGPGILLAPAGYRIFDQFRQVDSSLTVLLTNPLQRNRSIALA